MKQITILALILLTAILIVGCAGQKDQQAQEDTTTVQEDITQTTSESEDVSLSQEELDKLKADIESIETEEVGGLSD